jgi:NAD(P)-dependent dehydrogenase (short-subunit alcohol dehydrogenase family)
MELTERQWLAVLKVNVISAALCIKHAASRMAAQGGGSIVCTASIAGLRAGSGTAAYSASKAAVISMTQVSACELGGTGIRVNALCPGAVKTQMLDFVLDETESFCKSNAPIARMGRADEVAGAALFLASDESAYITGQILVVDGGLTAGLRGNWGHLGATSQPAKATSD